MPAHTRTVCLEFFGQARDAIPAIVEISDYLARHGAARGVLLAGLEHLDERYLKAVGYATKSKRGALPKMVLIGDIVGDDEDAVALRASDVVRIANARSGEGFIAVGAEARKAFWRDRSRTAAIARHTNAFKINEDVVIPLERLGEYTDAIERINIELSSRNKLGLLDDARSVPRRRASARQDRRCRHRPSAARRRLRRRSVPTAHRGRGCNARRRWSWLATCMDRRLHACLDELVQRLGYDTVLAATARTASHRSCAARVRLAAGPHDPRVVEDARCARSCAASSRAVRSRRCWRLLEAIHERVLRGRVFVALHMHAGDGNVHTNIPVNSDDYEMLQEANRAVARIMAHRAQPRRRDLRRARHRHHQARVPDRRRDRRSSVATRSASIRTAASTSGKLLPGGDLRNAYTPSFNLMGHESLIMQQSDINSISDAIKDCLRCGKCKPVCATHVPRANLLYSPRNKILATSLLIEAFLYEEQTRRGVSIRHWDEFSDVADHCTVCHKCETPCPVEHRLRRCVDGDARPAAAHGQEALQSRHRGVDVLPERDQSGDHQADAQGR